MSADAGDAGGEHVVREGTVDEVIRGAASWCIVHGDALHVLRDLPDGCVGAFITDPPYSSGGAFRGDRVKGTAAKYVSTGTSTGVECAANYSCQSTSQGRSFCMPESGLGLSGVGVPSVLCPPVTGYQQLLWSNAYCAISCGSAQDCPSHLSRCEDSPFAGAGQFEAIKYCVPP